MNIKNYILINYCSKLLSGVSGEETLTFSYRNSLLDLELVEVDGVLVVVGVELVVAINSASNSLVCSGLVCECLGGAGAFLLLERRFLSNIGPRPLPPEHGTCNWLVVGGADEILVVVDVGVITTSLLPPAWLLPLPTAPQNVEVDGVVVGSPEPLAAVVDVSVCDRIAGITSIPSPGVVWPDESWTTVILLHSSWRRSSILPIRCDIRCISSRTSTFKSKTVAIKSRCAKVGGSSLSPVSYVHEVVARDEAISIWRSRSNAKFLSLSRLGGDVSTSPPSSIVSWRANVAWLAGSFWAFGNT